MSDAKEMELKVAKAIFLTKPQHPQACFDDMPSIMANHYFDQARAAIEAMNIPALLAETRNKALEEAAREADNFISDGDSGDAAFVIAVNIRALKAKGTVSVGSGGDNRT